MVMYCNVFMLYLSFHHFFSIDENPEASTLHPVGFYVVLSDFRTHHGHLKIGVFYAHLPIFLVP